ncbi:MAG: abortive infection family protein [Candidatus Falkowbacteria bacterium]|nr:MAG: abortive infection family protein [Candidatus Falkowbacteria bacterium]
MQKLKEVITGKSRWNGLLSYISLVEENKTSNPNASLDGAKSILETISKTILSDKNISYRSDESVGNLVKLAFSSLPIFTKFSEIEAEKSKAILNAFATISNSVGMFRNDHGFFAHGQDLQSEKFDRYLLDLAISSSDLLASFLIISHAEDLKDRKRVYYEENDEFNRYIDETSEEYPIVKGIQLSPSRALFSDQDAYKEELLIFINEKINLIERLEKSENFISTRSICSSLIPLRDYLTENELKRVARSGINNPHIYRILGHGYTRGLFTWVIKEKSSSLSAEELSGLEIAFTKKLY